MLLWEKLHGLVLSLGTAQATAIVEKLNGKRSQMARRDGTNHRETLMSRGSRFLGEAALLPVFLPLVSCQEGFAVGATAA